MLSPKTNRNIARIIPFGLIWLVFSIVYLLLEKGILGKLAYYPSTGNPYNFTASIFITIFFSVITGLSVGTLEILYFNKLFIQRNFSKKIIYKSGTYLFIILSLLVVVTVIGNAIQLQMPVFNKQVLGNTRAFFLNYSFWSVAVYIAAITCVSLFYNEVSENIGHNVLLNFFTGKYHSPKEEERIFMFLDIKSSTSIAENIGHLNYFNMLKDYYADLSDPVVAYSGEIYQYVGDEIVVSWKLKNGLQTNNCIHCFFAMKAAISRRKDKYNEKYGLLPGFKAGFHLGKVTTGEIGVIKKEIIFTGDVLNTTARIQGCCNAYKTDILISGQLMEKLTLTAPFKISALGENELRGRDEKIVLYTID